MTTRTEPDAESAGCQATVDTRRDAAGRGSARVVADERRRIERDIHDGVQQRLTALRVRIGMAAERLRARGDHDASTTLLGFGTEVEQAIEELREVAHGMYPALLASHGLSAALTAVAKHAAQSVTVAADGVGRYAPEVESAIYFSVLAALDNAARYASEAAVAVAVWEADKRLHFSVTDGGHGFHANGSPAGRGLANMRDRITGVNGTFRVESSRYHGTRITASVPDARSSNERNGHR